jgi:hypothetical protein
MGPRIAAPVRWRAPSCPQRHRDLLAAFVQHLVQRWLQAAGLAAEFGVE